MSNCLFCQIISGKIPANIVHKDDHAVAFTDIAPKAPLHLLIIPRRHTETLNDLVTADDTPMGHIIRLAAKLAADNGFDESGYRLVLNCNRDAGQSVFHVHLHLLAGRTLTWPPG